MTEKNYNPKQKERKAMAKAAAAEKVRKNVVKDIEGANKGNEKVPKVPEKQAVKEEKIAEKEEAKFEKQDVRKKKSEKSEEKKEEKPAEKKITKPKAKKKEAVINSFNLPISTKKAAGICRFIKGKEIENAIADLRDVAGGKKAVPMRGEIPHRKGKIMSGLFPKKAAKEFIVVLRGLLGNANVNDIDEPIIAEAVANIASRPYGRFGRVRRKRTHLKIIARSKAEKKKRVKKKIKKKMAKKKKEGRKK